MHAHRPNEAHMRTLEIEDDVYQFLLHHVAHIGEDASSILRRLLRMESVSPLTATRDDPGHAHSRPLAQFVESADLLHMRSATARYLAILGHAYERTPDRFAKIVAIAGRKRRYFGLSREQIAQSGKATHPQQIPNSPYWAMTNSSTGDKREILRHSLQLLEYDVGQIDKACAAIA
jgi:negative modulator of initiation of replication